jgi:hypothetical protein
MAKARVGLIDRLVLGAIAGIVGTAAMTASMRAMHKRLPRSERYALPPREIVERVLPEEAAGERPLQIATMTAHFGYGAASGAVAALSRLSREPLPGALYGVLVWSVSYFGWIPAVGILRSADQHPLRRNLLMIAAHLVWGSITLATLGELERAQAEVFADRGGQKDY